MHLVRGPQLAELQVQDPCGHLLGDVGEPDLLRQLDEREPGGLGAVHQRRGQLVEPAPGLHDEPGRAGPCEVGDVTLQPGVVGRQQQPRGQQQLAAAQQPRHVGDLGGVRPAHPHVQTTGACHDPWPAGLHRRHRQDLADGGVHAGEGLLAVRHQAHATPAADRLSAMGRGGLAVCTRTPSRSSPGSVCASAGGYRPDVTEQSQFVVRAP